MGFHVEDVFAIGTSTMETLFALLLLGFELLFESFNSLQTFLMLFLDPLLALLHILLELCRELFNSFLELLIAGFGLENEHTLISINLFKNYSTLALRALSTTDKRWFKDKTMSSRELS